MKMIMRKILLLLAIIGLFMTGCKDFLDMPPKNVKVIYTTEDVKEAMSLFLYATAKSNAGGYNRKTSYNIVYYSGGRIMYPFSRYINVCAAMASDDIEMLGFVNNDMNRPDRGGATYENEFKEIRNWESYRFANQTWKAAFLCVGYLNNVLHDLSGVPDYDKTEHERISGEARVIRAYYLFRLNALFAPYDKNDFGIPMTFDAEATAGSSRWKQTDLYKTLIRELTEVLEYETVPKDSWNMFYNKRIIKAILAQIYQFKAGSCAGEPDDWDKAESYAREARGDSRIENTVEEQKELNYAPSDKDYYTLDKPHMFALLRIAHPGDGGNNYSPWGAPSDPQQMVSPELYAMYDAADIRVQTFFKLVNNSPYWVKLQSTDNVDVCSETHPLFRFSDLLLIEAEAKARKNDPEALTLLNEFKSSKIPGYTGYSGKDVLDEILRERRKEFALEEQMRWLDMKRLGVSVKREALDDDNNVQTYRLEANDYRYALPIPEELELMYNNIPQNPGWLENKKNK